MKSSIAAKFLLPVAGLAILLLSLSSYLNYEDAKAEQLALVNRQVGLALAFDLAIREYMAGEVRPRVARLVAPDEFVPELMSSSYAARRIFEKVQERFPDYIIKFSSANPRNPQNLAGPDELRLIEYFNRHPDKNTWSGEVVMDGQLYLAKFSARRMKPDCLACHGNPDDAPASIIERYGPTAGFNNPLGKVVALDTVAIPLQKVRADLLGRVVKRAVVVVGCLVSLLVVVGWLFRRVVTRRLETMAVHFQRIADQPDAERIKSLEVKGDDEIAALARSFNAMAERLRRAHGTLEQRVSERTADLAAANRDLEREVAERKRAEQQLAVRAAQQAAIAEFGQRALSIRELPELFDQAVHLASRVLNTSHAKVLEHVPEAGHLILRAGVGWREGLVGQAVVPGDAASQAGYTLQRSEPVIVDDLAAETRFEAPELLRSHGIVSGLSVAIPGDERPFGVLSVHSTERRSFSADDSHFLRSIANILAEAIARKHTEKQLLQAQKMESIGQLAAGIAHEINTPTQYVGDNTRFLRESVEDLLKALDTCVALATRPEPSDPGSRRELIEQALRELDIDFLREEIPKAIDQSLEGLQRVTQIVRAMKDFSHPGGAEKQTVDLNKAIQSTITVARNEWKYVADVVTDFDPDLPLVPCMVGDFNQVMLNLLVNAAHAIADVVGDGSRGKGTITVSTRRDGDWVEVRVQDNGTGIPEQYRARVFDHFFTTKEVGKGTGQGLSLAYRVITENHGGTITFETETGRGTTFIIRLPLTAPTDDDHEHAQTQDTVC